MQDLCTPYVINAANPNLRPKMTELEFTHIIAFQFLQIHYQETEIDLWSPC